VGRFLFGLSERESSLVGTFACPNCLYDLPRLSAMKEIFHITAYFSGRVQGVGFRYQTLQVAKGFEVTGYVKNLADGRVQLEAGGEQREVEDFVAEVEEQLAAYIRHTEKGAGMRKQKFFSFTIQ
jgi:acylphosphatase